MPASGLSHLTVLSPGEGEGVFEERRRTQGREREREREDQLNRGGREVEKERFPLLFWKASVYGHVLLAPLSFPLWGGVGVCGGSTHWDAIYGLFGDTRLRKKHKVCFYCF